MVGYFDPFFKCVKLENCSASLNPDHDYKENSALLLTKKSTHPNGRLFWSFCKCVNLENSVLSLCIQTHDYKENIALHC